MSDSRCAMRIVTQEDTSFSYLESGVGIPLVLLHGVGSGARSWNAQLGNLTDIFRVVAWDAPGYGASTPVESAIPTASDYAVRLKMFADFLGLDRFHLVGHSLGAIMAARFALEFGSRVMGLTLVSPSSGHARLPQEEKDKLRNGRLNNLRKLGPRGMACERGPRLVSPDADDAVKTLVIETMAQIRPDGYTQAVEMLSVSDTAKDVARLADDLPIQFIIGSCDIVTPPEGTLAIAKNRPDAKVHILSGCGHALYLERPEAFNELLIHFASTDKSTSR